MKAGVYFGILFAFLSCVYGAEKEFYNLEEAPQLYEKYLKDYDKSYENVTSLLVHYEAFKKTLVLITESNKVSTSAVFGLNRLADYTREELNSLFGVLDPYKLGDSGLEGAV